MPYGLLFQLGSVRSGLVVTGRGVSRPREIAASVPSPRLRRGRDGSPAHCRGPKGGSVASVLQWLSQNTVSAWCVQEVSLPPHAWGRVGVGGVQPVGEIAFTPTSILPRQRGRMPFRARAVEFWDTHFAAEAHQCLGGARSPAIPCDCDCAAQGRGGMLFAYGLSSNNAPSIRCTCCSLSHSLVSALCTSRRTSFA